MAHLLTGRGTAWLVLLASIVVLGLGILLLPHPSSTALINPATSGDSQSVARWQAAVPAADLTNGIVVWSRVDGAPLSATDRTQITARDHAVAALSQQPKTAWPQLSTDRKVVLAIVPVKTSSALRDATAVADSLTSTARAGLPSTLRVRLTGDLATLAASARTAQGAGAPPGVFWLILLAAALLILAGRSALLWIIPTLLVILTGDASVLAARAIGAAVGLPIGSADASVIQAIGLGAAAAGAVLLVLRYRREAVGTTDRFASGAAAWRSAAPAIGATALILCLGALVFLSSPSSRVRAIGLAAAIVIAIATIVMLVAVPAALVMLPMPTSWATSTPAPAARFSARRTVLFSFAASILVLGVSAGFAEVLVAVNSAGDASATQARALIDRSYTRGYGNQTIMIVPSSLKGETSVVAPTTLAMNLADAHSVTVGPSHDGRTELVTYFDIDPGSARASATIRTLRGLIQSTGGPTATSLVGGSDAAAVDRANAETFTLAVSVPAAIILCAILLAVAAMLSALLPQPGASAAARAGADAPGGGT